MPEYIRVPLSRGKFALIDPEDAERVLAHKWSGFHRVNRQGQRKWVAVVRQIRVGPGRHFRTIYLHRFLLDAPDGVDVDHKNGNALDCRRSNLRLASDMQNACNKAGFRRRTSQYKGVSWEQWTGRWRVQIKAGPAYVSGGRFDDEVQAARRYDELARDLHGEFARLNFPREDYGQEEAA